MCGKNANEKREVELPWCWAHDTERVNTESPLMSVGGAWG